MNSFHTETRASKYKETQRSIQTMEKQLADLDIQKSLLEAQIADEALYANALSPTATQKDLELYERRQTRRAHELQMRLIVPPGIWDEDLDTHLEDSESWTVDGYECSMVRSLDRTWQGFVKPLAGDVGNTEAFGRNVTVSFENGVYKLSYDQCWDSTPVPIGTMLLMKKSMWTHYTTYEESKDHVNAFVRWIQERLERKKQRGRDSPESMESEDEEGQEAQEELCEFHAWMGHYCSGNCYSKDE